MKLRPMVGLVWSSTYLVATLRDGQASHTALVRREGEDLGHTKAKR